MYSQHSTSLYIQAPWPCKKAAAKSNRRPTEQNDIHEINYENNMEIILQANEWYKSMCLYGCERVNVRYLDVWDGTLAICNDWLVFVWQKMERC